MIKNLFIACLLLFFSVSCKENKTTESDTSKSKAVETEKLETLTDARKGFTTKLNKQSGAKGEVETPPADLFTIVQYPTAIGKMTAYLSVIPDGGKLHPAMIWITGGFGNDIGDVWTAQDPENDQSASVLREAGIVMMYPSQRGGNTNPGADETCYGEIDDILAAAEFLAKQKGVDPKRIYLGGHSTGGTKVLLAAACNNNFRAVFSLGPASDVMAYGDEYVTFNSGNEKEVELRKPIRWLSAMQTPVFVFEGAGGNIGELEAMQAEATDLGNTSTHFYPVKDKDHFSAIQPVSKIIAKKIMEDNNGGAVKMDFETALKDLK